MHPESGSPGVLASCVPPGQVTTVLLMAACVLGGAGIVAQGPLPGDVALTTTLQQLFGSRPAWALWLTNSAKLPGVLIVIAFACACAWARHGRSAVWLPVLCYVGALGASFGLRALIFVPRPDDTLVQVASASIDSGLPSTFALVYAGVFGVALVDSAPRTANGLVLGCFAAGLIATGCGARIVLGGHWPSQVAASALLALGCARWFTLSFLRRTRNTEAFPTA